MSGYLDRRVSWTKTSDVDYPLEAIVDGSKWRLRLGDFPAEALFTLEVEGHAILEFNDWPRAWREPK